MSENFQQKESVSHSQLVIILTTVLRLVASLAVTMLIGRELEPADFGFYALIITLFVLARELMDIGSTSLAVREIALEPSSERAILEKLVGLRTALGVVFGALCLYFAWQQSEFSHRWVLSLTALILPLLAVGALGVVYQLRQNMLPPAINSLSLQYGLLLACLGLYYIQAPAWTYPCLLLVRELCGLLWLKMHAGKTLGYTVTANFGFQNMRSFLRKLAVVGAAAAMYNLYFYVGPLLIWLFRPAQEMGAYSAAFRPISQILSFPIMLMVPLLPILTQFATSDRIALQRQAGCFIPLAIGMGAIGGVIGVELSADVLSVLYGDTYIEGPLSAVISLQTLSLSFAFSMATAVVIMFLLALGLERVLVLMCSMGLLINILCNIILLPSYGFTAAAYATLLTEVSVFLFGVMTMFRSRIWIVSVPSLIACLMPALVLFTAIQLIPHAESRLLKLPPIFGMTALAVVCMLFLPSTKRGREDLSRQAVDAVTH